MLSKLHHKSSSWEVYSTCFESSCETRPNSYTGIHFQSCQHYSINGRKNSRCSTIFLISVNWFQMAGSTVFFYSVVPYGFITLLIIWENTFYFPIQLKCNIWKGIMTIGLLCWDTPFSFKYKIHYWWGRPLGNTQDFAFSYAYMMIFMLFRTT